MVRVTNDQKIILEVLSVISYQRNANYQYLRRYYNPYNINIKKKKQQKLTMVWEKQILIQCWWKGRVLNSLQK